MDTNTTLGEAEGRVAEAARALGTSSDARCKTTEKALCAATDDAVGALVSLAKKEAANSEAPSEDNDQGEVSGEHVGTEPTTEAAPRAAQAGTQGSTGRTGGGAEKASRAAVANEGAQTSQRKPAADTTALLLLLPMTRLTSDTEA
ncbi:hypothetical protein ERJ75_001184800 [Trypanosoma vivax]|nr:hypothetical protein ERJ75_001184800 [Trypanosoma vivax]